MSGDRAQKKVHLKVRWGSVPYQSSDEQVTSSAKSPVMTGIRHNENAKLVMRSTNKRPSLELKIKEHKPLSEPADDAEKAQFFLYLVTLAYCEKDISTLAQVVFLSIKEEEDTRTVAKALINNAKNTAPQTPRFEWSALRVQGSQTLNNNKSSKLVTQLYNVRSASDECRG